MHVGCPVTVQLSTTDPDGDRVTCRFAQTELECGEACQRFPYFDLNEVIVSFHLCCVYPCRFGNHVPKEKFV